MEMDKWVKLWSCVVLLVLIVAWGVGAVYAQDDSVVRIAYFYRDNCDYCTAVINDVLVPLQEKYGDQLQIKMVQYRDPSQPSELDPAKYEMLLRAEKMFGVTPEERDIPTLVVGRQVLIGEDEIRERLSCLLDTCVGAGGTSWPDIPGLETITPGLEALPVESDGSPGLISPPFEGVDTCSDEEPVCESGAPSIWMAYLYEVGCQKCSRAESDIQYMRSSYPQLVVEELNIYDSVDLAQWLARRVGREDDLHIPALFIGDDVLIGQEEITPQNLDALMEKYAPTGAEPVWSEFESEESPQLPSVLAVVGAGLVDGLNPCAFATLIFFVSYLAASERRGWEILAVGVAFTVGVFLTYVAIGLGLYRVLDVVRDEYAAVGRGVSTLIALLCGLFAVLSFLDYLKARRGQIEDMALVMPEGLRRRVHTVIRRTSSVRAFVPVALFTGAAVSFLELACTGQLYLAMLISMVNAAEAQVQAVPLLMLYNLMFVSPLIVVFVMVYFGTSSLQLGLFLRRHTAMVKLGTALLFAVFATWLVVSVVV